MPTSTFYNDNLFRSYPFVAHEELEEGYSRDFPTKLIVGAKVLCGFGSYFPSFPTVTLRHWETLTNTFRAGFYLEADGYSNSIHIDIPKNTAPLTHIFSPESEHTRIRLTIGDLSGFTYLSSHSLYLRLEPTCILWLKHRGISAIQVINENRDRVADAITNNTSVSDEYKNAWLNTSFWRQPGLIGDEGLLFSEGFNCEWSTFVTENRLVVWPRTSAGAGPVREFLSLGETPSGPVGISEIPGNIADLKIRPDGLLHQDDVLYAFSGATGPEITVDRTSRTITVRNDIDANTVSIAVASLQGKGC